MQIALDISCSLCVTVFSAIELMDNVSIDIIEARNERHIYYDADWASYPTGWRSTTRYYVFIGGNLISLKRNKILLPSLV